MCLIPSRRRTADASRATATGMLPPRVTPAGRRGPAQDMTSNRGLSIALHAAMMTSRASTVPSEAVSGERRGQRQGSKLAKVDASAGPGAAALI